MRRTRILAAALGLVGLAGCSRSPSEPAGGAQPSPNSVPPAVASAATHEARPPQLPTSGPFARHAPPKALALAWDDPSRWQKRIPSAPIRAAEYRIPRTGADTEDGECTVITFGPGQGGAVDDNIERWARQMKPTTSDIKRSTRTVHGMTVTRVEVPGTYTPMAMPGLVPPGPPRPNYRLVGAIVEAPSGEWFFKIIGPDETAKAAGPELDKLVDSIHENASAAPSASP